MEVKPGYKQTEAGIIPEDWDETKLGYGITLLSGQHILASHCNIRGVGVPYITGPADFPDGVISHSKFTDRPSTICKAGDILVTVKGSGAGSLVVADASYCISRQLMAIRVSDWDKSFVFYSLLQNATQFKAASTGLIPGLSRSDIKDQLLPLPKLPEQHAIAEALSDVDGLLGGLDRLIAKKRDLKQAAMQQLLTGKTRLPGFDGEWESKTLGDIVERIVGGGTPSRTNSAFWGSEIPWVTVKDFATFDPRQTQESITRVGLNNSASNLIPAGTLITSTRMALGKAVVYEVDVAINQDLKALFLKRDASVQFLFFWFEHFGKAIDDLGSGSTVKGISIAELKRLPFLTPSLAEQIAIAEVLADMDAELAALEQRREKTRDLKQGMMQELLTGKTRLV